MDVPTAALHSLIGFHTIARRHESLYAFVARLVRSNLLYEREVWDLLPKSWVLSVFTSKDDDVDGLLTDFSRALPSVAAQDLQSKLSIDPWLLFPSITDAAKRRLRGCPKCLALGYHSYAFHDSLLAACPLHQLPLSDRCPHCSTPLWWGYSGPRDSAFKCPRGCDLLTGLHSGLDDELFDQLAGHLDRHFALIGQLRAFMRFASGPVRAIHPHRLSDPDYYDGVRPLEGLVPAILAAVRHYVKDLPKLEAHYEQASNAWDIYVRPVEEHEIINPATQDTRQMMSAFRRGIYRTELPLGSPIDADLLEKLDAFAMLVNDGVVPQISLESYVLTNADVHSLALILSAGHDASYAHYDLALRDLLESIAVHFRRTEDGCTETSGLFVAESISGLLQTPMALLWIRAQVTRASQDAGATYSESIDF